MKRSPEFHPLSHDHHVALEHALRLRRATSHDVEAVTARFLEFFRADGERHFAQEETLLVPVIPDDEAEARQRLIDDHAEIRQQAKALEEQPSQVAAVHLGERLADHVRFEERQLFPMLEARLSPTVLADLGRRLAHP